MLLSSLQISASLCTTTVFNTLCWDRQEVVVVRKSDEEPPAKKRNSSKIKQIDSDGKTLSKFTSFCNNYVHQTVKLCICKRREYATVDLARIEHPQTQQSITDWSMIGFGHYRTLRDILPKGQQSHQDRLSPWRPSGNVC